MSHRRPNAEALRADPRAEPKMARTERSEHTGAVSPTRGVKVAVIAVSGPWLCRWATASRSAWGDRLHHPLSCPSDANVHLRAGRRRVVRRTDLGMRQKKQYRAFDRNRCRVGRPRAVGRCDQSHQGSNHLQLAIAHCHAVGQLGVHRHGA